MNIFDFAKEKERHAELLYRELADQAPTEGLARIFSTLADEEAKHFEVVDQLSEGVPTHVAQTSVLGDAKQTFERMKASAEQLEGKTLGQPELYAKARDIERQSRDFYREKAGEVESTEQRRILEQLAGEEDKHYLLLDNICTFVARPRTYLENAEFTHFDDYVAGEF